MYICFKKIDIIKNPIPIFIKFSTLSLKYKFSKLNWFYDSNLTK